MYTFKLLTQSILLLLCLFQPFVANAQEEKQSDKATQLALPPVTQNYIFVYSGPQLEFAIDPGSVSIPADKNKKDELEIRYTLKATGKKGAVNISYEGIRCDKHQKILYATARSDGSWSRVRSPEWSPVNKTGNNIQHATLAENFFCEGNTLAGSRDSILERIKLNRPLAY